MIPRWTLGAGALLLAACTDDTASLFGDGDGATGTSSGGEASSSAGGAAGSLCSPAGPQTACDHCVYDRCCPEVGRCGRGTPCDALTTCARAKNCFGRAGFLACMTLACPAEATKGAVADFQALAGCIRTDCANLCDP